MTGPGTYVHQPTVIHAMQYTPDTADDLKAWLVTALGSVMFHMVGVGNGHLAIETLEGDRDCPYGYWVVQGVAGEFYPVHPDIFARNYKPAGGEF